jgi:hypothetical protein
MATVLNPGANPTLSSTDAPGALAPGVVETLDRLVRLGAEPDRVAKEADENFIAAEKARFAPTVTEATKLHAAIQERAAAFEPLLSKLDRVRWSAVALAMPRAGAGDIPALVAELRGRLRQREALADAPAVLRDLSKASIRAQAPKRVEDAVREAKDTPTWLDNVYKKLLTRIDDVGAKLRANEDSALAEARRLVRVTPIEIPSPTPTPPPSKTVADFDPLV